MTRTISNSDDLIDSRDVIKRIEELQSDLQTNFDTEDGDMSAAPEVDWSNSVQVASLEQLMPARWARMDDSELMSELLALLNLQEEASDAPDWPHGETLIRDSYFEEYAQELAEDCDMVTPGASWPNTCIDWEQAARELQQDYTSVEFDGITYWIRS